MKGCTAVLVVSLLCAAPLTAHSQEVITGTKFNAFRASAANYMNMPVVLEDTFGNIVEQFSIIEIGNNLTSNMYVKFDLGQCPYPCIGMRTTPVMSGLDQVGPSDLVRVTGNLNTIQEKQKRVRVSGRYTGGPSYSERINVYGPKESEIYFSVSSVEKGWGKDDSVQDMAEEGKNLSPVHYQEVKAGEDPIKEEEVEHLADKAIWFQGKYDGLDENLTELETAAGVSPDTIIKFTVDAGADRVPCYIPFSESNLAGFKALEKGTEVHVYGRIRKKETPKGWIAGFVADRVDKVVITEAPPEAEEGAGSAGKASEPEKESAAPAAAETGLLPVSAGELPPPPL